MRLSLIVAAAENGVIGRGNALPWRLSGDLQYFKRVTLGKPVIMGRKTYESIGRPLPGRSNIVISRRSDFTAPGIAVVASLEDAMAMAADAAAAETTAEAMVIGGAEIYSLALPLADRLYLTEVHGRVEGDTELPEICWSEWREISRETHTAGTDDSHDYSFVVYEKRVRA